MHLVLHRYKHIECPCNTLGTTLCKSQKTDTSTAGTTDTTLLKTTAAIKSNDDNNNNIKNSRKTGEGEKSVIPVIPGTPDDDSGSYKSAVPSVVPNNLCGKCGF